MAFLMLHRLILKVTKFQLPPPKRFGTVVKNIFEGAIMPPPMSNRVKLLHIFMVENSLALHSTNGGTSRDR